MFARHFDVRKLGGRAPAVLHVFQVQDGAQLFLLKFLLLILYDANY
jgi:hypothetical protein